MPPPQSDEPAQRLRVPLFRGVKIGADGKSETTFILYKEGERGELSGFIRIGQKSYPIQATVEAFPPSGVERTVAVNTAPERTGPPPAPQRYCDAPVPEMESCTAAQRLDRVGREVVSSEIISCELPPYLQCLK